MQSIYYVGIAKALLIILVCIVYPALLASSYQLRNNDEELMQNRKNWTTVLTTLIALFCAAFGFVGDFKQNILETYTKIAKGAPAKTVQESFQKFALAVSTSSATVSEFEKCLNKILIDNENTLAFRIPMANVDNEIDPKAKFFVLKDGKVVYRYSMILGIPNAVVDQMYDVLVPRWQGTSEATKRFDRISGYIVDTKEKNNEQQSVRDPVVAEHIDESHSKLKWQQALRNVFNREQAREVLDKFGISCDVGKPQATSQLTSIAKPKFNIQLVGTPYFISEIRKPASLEELNATIAKLPAKAQKVIKELNATIAKLPAQAQKVIANSDPSVFWRNPDDWAFVFGNSVLLAIGIPHRMDNRFSLVMYDGNTVEDVHLKFLKKAIDTEKNENATAAEWMQEKTQLENEEQFNTYAAIWDGVNAKFGKGGAPTQKGVNQITAVQKTPVANPAASK